MTRRCNCESKHCTHTPGACPTPAAPFVRMAYVGPICNGCAQRAQDTGGGQYVERRP